MSDLESVHLKIPYLAAAQAQKHVTHNEALRRLDTVVQLSVIDSGLADPPASPAEGDRYIVAAAATGDWAGEDGNVTAFVDGAWQFLTPDVGWLAYDAAGATLLVYEASGWEAASGHVDSVSELGINATADATNRLSVRSDAVLFSSIDAGSGGTGDVRFVVNKETAADTASLLFQTGFSGRAEVGLAGDDDFVFKVSPDGSAWAEAIRIDKDTGLPAILYDNATSGLAATTVQDAIVEVAAAGGGGGGAVTSVFGRTGAVVAAASDYDASQIDNDSGVGGATVKDALDALAGGKQDADATLAALAALGTAADRIAYTTGVDAWAETAITAAGRAILDDADASAQRTTLGLAIGSDVQAHAANLDGWAGETVADYYTAAAVDALVANMVESDTSADGVTGSDAVANIVSCTQAEYDAGTPDAATLYLITDA
jgi:hypothetical protein